MANYPQWTQTIHHDGSHVYVSNPLPKLNETVTIALRVGLNVPIVGVYLVSMPDGEIKLTQMQVTQSTTLMRYEVEMLVNQPRNTYQFKIITESDGAFYFNARGISKAESSDIDSFTIIADYQAPTWVNNAVFYQIFPDRFENGDPSNDVQEGEYEREGAWTRKRDWGSPPLAWETSRSIDFYGGDLLGIEQHLDYLQSLGINSLYLCPIFTAKSNHKYDIMDFWQVDKHFGGNDALVSLRKVLDARDMKLILDITPNHIGREHKWFEDALADDNAPSSVYFAKDEETGTYETWLGVPSLIKLNYASEELRDVMYRNDDSALQFWLDEPYRIDGWRLDVANMTGNLKANQLGEDVFREMRPYLKSHGDDVYIMGEHFHDGTHYTQGDQLDAIMNYRGFNTPMRRWLGGEDTHGADGHSHADTRLMDTEAMVEQWQMYLARVPYAIVLQQFNQLGSHDTTRILHVVDGDLALAKLGTALLMAFVGVPCIYYGDEIAMTGGRDPDNRRCMTWDESEWDVDMLAFTKQVIEIRKSSDAFKTGGFQVIYGEGDTVAFMRESKDEKWLIIGHRGTDDTTIELSLDGIGLVDGTILKDTLSDTQVTVMNSQLSVTLVHGQAMYLRVQE